MEDVAAPKKSTTLSVDRAAFLLLRVKKAFKKKRQHRKEKPTQLAGTTLTTQNRSCRKAPPPLLRSRTLPAIIVPGIPVVSLQTDGNYAHLLDEHLDYNTNYSRKPLLYKNLVPVINSKSLKLPSEDTPFAYRRKSSGSSTTCPNAQVHNANNQQQQQYEQPQQQQRYDASLIQTPDGLECHPDGSVLLRIPAPHVVAARAYRLSSSIKRPNTVVRTHTHAQQPNIPTHETSPISNATSGGGGRVSSGSNVAAGSGSVSSAATANTTALTRLVKLLHQSSSNKTSHSDYSFLGTLAPNGEEAPRRLSWERRKDSSALQRSASIDSVAEAVWSDTPRPSLDIPRTAVAPFSKRPSASSLFSNCSTSSQNAQLNINYSEASSGGSAGNSRRESLLSPSSTRRNKLTRILNDNVLPQNHKNSNIDIPKSSTHNITSLSDDDDDDDICSVIIRTSQHHHHNQEHQQKSNYNSNQIKSPQRKQRWSVEQLTNNAGPVTRPLRRTAISHTPADLKEMEFLIPNAPSLSTSIVTESQLNSLSISRQSAASSSSSASASTSSVRVPSYLRMSHPKNAKLNAAQTAACSDENTDANAQTLSVYRQPASARSKGGNTPYHSKMSKKQLKLAQAQLDKFTQINVHLHALFSAVEHGHLDKARTILESTDVDVNSINSDGLSALDVAVLSNNRSMTKMLLQHGAIEGNQFSTDSIGTKLNALLKDAESRIHDLSGSTDGTCQPLFASRPSISSIIIGNTSSSVTGCTGNEIDKQIGIWERRVKGLRRMLLGWDQARPPDAPASVTVDVTGENAIAVQILEPFDGAIGTKFKIQWSTRSDFRNVVGERDLLDWNSFHGTMGVQCHINGLTQGRRYFIRAACGNVKGYGPYKTSIPASVVPSSWRDLNNREDRYVGRQRLLDNLFTAVRLARPADVSELSLESTSVQRRNPKKKTSIKQLFSVASRFQKNLRRGIYFNCIVYCEDKVLVTSEDFLPVIEIDETYPGTLHSDYHWLMKVACTWEDVKSLRSDMERNLTSASHFRTKLLSAICQMQSALGLTDLGQLYYKPLRDSHGTVVLSCVQTVKSQKTVSILNSRWLPINKLQKKIVALHEDYNITEMLISSIAEQIQYHQASTQRLSAGLYLGYLKMQCTVEQIEVVVPAKTPNVLPHFKVRDNSHITAEEWQVLKRNPNAMESSSSVSVQRLSLDFNANSEETTEVQRLFLYDLATAALKLFAYMNIRTEDAETHRLYDVEIIEHSREISFLIICPAVELTCAAPGQSEFLLQHDDLVSLSIQAFEMIHLRTYQSGIIQKYARLSCILELDTTIANHSHREAFSTSELQTAKDRLAKLHELTASLNAVWKSVRWLMDVIAFARDKNAQPAVAMHEILGFAQTSDEVLQSNEKNQLLQLPIREAKYTKTGSGRGSWPGPTGSSPTSALAVEHSKSEQNLGCNAATTPTSVTILSTKCLETLQTKAAASETTSQTQHLQVTSEYTRSDISLRKNSGDSMTSEYTSQSFYSTADSAVCSSNDLGTIFHSIPPSRSADMLTLATAQALKKSNSTVTHRKRTSSNITSSACSNQTPIISVSSSVPLLPTKATMTDSNPSLKSEEQTTPFKAQTSQAETQMQNPSIVKSKASSSVNLRDGGLYLRTTLSALQTEMKVTASITDESQRNVVKGTSSSKNVSRQSSEEDTASASSAATDQTASGIIQVYTAYNTGLASGTSLKLHVTPKTSAREVINLVVKQLNMAAMLKGNNGPIYTSEMLENFCLVAVIGARERCLRDDFKPLQLQNPWKKGRLYVRQKHELLAAIEHSNRKSQLI